MVGKYVDLADSYKSLNEAMVHGGIANEARVKIDYVDAEELEKGSPAAAPGECRRDHHPGGFGERGTEGKIRAVRYAREKECRFSASASAADGGHRVSRATWSGLSGPTPAKFDEDPPIR